MIFDKLNYNLFFELFDNDPLPKLISEIDTLKIVFANKAAKEFYGYGDKLCDLYIYDINTLPKELLLNLASQNKDNQKILNFKHKLANNEIRDVKVNCVLLTINNKQYIFSTIIDVTEQNKAFSEISKIKQEYIQLFKSLTIPLLYCEFQNNQTDFEIINYNDIFKNLFLISKDNLNKLQLSEQNIALDLLIEAIHLNLLNPNKVTIEIRNFPYINKWIKINYIYLTKEHFLVMLENITENIIYENALNENQNFLHLILNLLHFPILLLDENGLIIYYNDAFKNLDDKLKIIGPQCKLGMNYFDICNNHSNDEQFKNICCLIIKSINDALNSKNSSQIFDFSIDNYYFSFKTTYLQKSNGYNILLTFEDITFRKLLENDLKTQYEKAKVMQQIAEEANSAKDKFLAIVSHEIRTPLNSIIGFTDLLMMQPLNNEQKELLGHIKVSSNMLLTLINDILDLSKIESKKMSVNESEFDLLNLLDEIVNITQSLAIKKKIKYLYSIDSAINFKIISDPLKLKQILLNLISNAIKFTPDEKHISLKVILLEQDEEYAKIYFEVYDEGIGISNDKIEEIFKPFVQADQSTFRQYGGTGLGLTIADKLVKLLGGEKINVQSKLNEGSNFNFTLKVKKGNLIPSNNNLLNENTFCNQNINTKLRVLLVEDNQTNIILACKALSLYGHEVSVALNGQEAIKMVSEKKYDIILMDIHMPIMDGISATKIIRLSNKEVPILAMTAAATKSDLDICLEAGMDGYIVKPISISEINNILFDAIKNKKAETEKSNIKTNIQPLNNVKEQSKVIENNKIQSEIFNANKLMNNMGGLKELAIDAINMFFEYQKQYYDDIEKSIKEENFDKIKKAAHKFKGTALNACATKVASILLQIETSAMNKSLNDCINLLSQLKISIEEFQNNNEVKQFISS